MGLDFRPVQGPSRHGLITVDDTARPRMPADASTLDGNEPGHLSEDDDTAGSQPDLTQWVTVTDLAGDASWYTRVK